MFALLCLIPSAASLTLPANTAYLINSMDSEYSESGAITGWQSPRTNILWGGYLGHSGKLRISALLSQASATARYQLRIDAKRLHKTLSATGSNPTFPELDIAEAGWVKLTLSAKGTAFGDASGLQLDGDSVADSKFNLKPRRNAASVHIGWPLAPNQEVEWFYNEVKAVTDPTVTYYMACGFRRGYFGMQVNSETERRIIFSIWDAGKEAVDRSKVSDDNRVKLLAKGEGVFADSFGNEGTGGHSHLTYPWKTPERQRFLVHAVADGTRSVYTGYYFHPEKRQWMVIASFSAPKDGHLLSGLYSFVENFGGDTGYLKRAAEFGSAWVRPKGGDWVQLKTARFTHDVTGGKDRFDYDLKPIGDRLILQNGGFEGPLLPYGTMFDLPGRTKPPKIDLDALH